MERRKAASQAYLQTGCWPCRVLHTHAIFPHNRSESHCREHTCREEHRVEGCSTLDGKHICILAALQGGARLLKWPAGCPNLRSGFVSRNLMLAGVQKRLFAHNLHFSMHAATRTGQRSHLRFALLNLTVPPRRSRREVLSLGVDGSQTEPEISEPQSESSQAASQELAPSVAGSRRQVSSRKHFSRQVPYQVQLRGRYENERVWLHWQCLVPHSRVAHAGRLSGRPCTGSICCEATASLSALSRPFRAIRPVPSSGPFCSRGSICYVPPLEFSPDRCPLT